MTNDKSAAVRNAQETDGSHHQIGGAFDHALANLLQLAHQTLVGDHPIYVFRTVGRRGGVGGARDEERGKEQ